MDARIDASSRTPRQERYGTPVRLTDAQMQHYLTEGFVVLQSQVPPEVHEHIRNRCEEIFETTGNPGNDILEMNPVIQLIFTDPVIRGALISILGEDCFMYPHRHCHQNVSGTPAQRNHKDSYEDDINVHHHRSRWAMAMYYPQRVTAAMGPTGITPGSQYFSDPASLADLTEIGVEGDAGTVVIVHYDLWHRALRNDSGRSRYMLKFLFCRASEPTRPAWDNREVDWKTPGGRKGDAMEPLWDAMWRWNRGETVHCPVRADAELAVEHLVSGPEIMRLRSAYMISPDTMASASNLFDLWRYEADDAEQRARTREYTNPCEHTIGYALGGLGAAGLSVLATALASEDWRIRGCASDVIGDIGLEAQSLAPQLVARLQDSSAWVRRNATEALGVLGSGSEEVTEALGQALGDADYLVGHNAALSLRKLGQATDDTIERLQEMSIHPELYRRKNALMALEVLLP